MIKRIVFTVVMLVILACAATMKPPVPIPVPTGIVLYAQSLPATVHVKFDTPPASQGITGVIITLDGTVLPVVPLPAPTASCSCTLVPLVLNTAGSHTVIAAPTNQLVSTDPTSSQTGPGVTVQFSLNAAPTAFTHPTVTQ